MHILLSNDDGIYAEGLRAAAECLSEFAEVTIVAPDSEQSAVSSKITTSLPLRVHRYNISSKFESYAVNGTPTDCIKLALGVILDKKPDIVVSGINHG
ncbi:MAG: 5'/3'-nucleotidase SurE, partial [Calditrichaeota bacterium]|nr:5'/3'-nucleotidase SurE [Calditrichota bacterium]